MLELLTLLRMRDVSYNKEKYLNYVEDIIYNNNCNVFRPNFKSVKYLFPE
jgi:hypothetical protein